MASKSAETILKLNKLTKDDEITWETSRFDPTSLTGTERMVGNAYTTVVNEKHLRLYKFEYRHYHDEDIFDYIPDFRLEFIDDRGKGEWIFPYDRAISDLYDTILYKVSGADDFFDSFLK
jgi:hypothetical protein